ncbi:hypothetical protein PQR37_03860 [Paraburkholderia nemoris]|uniref:hypothetical protein n=1 Tax=Paraburkholderia nemoris TaxID=2793076 RepID=UPI0038B9CAED
MGQAPTLALLEKVRRRISVFKPLRDAKRSSVYVFDSPKCDERLVIVGDIPFMYALIAEGDPAISGYIFQPSDDSEKGSRLPRMKVRYHDNRTEVWQFVNDEKSLGHGNGGKAIPDAKAELPRDRGTVTKGIAALRSQSKRLDNIFLLCSMCNRARGCNAWNEARLLDETLFASSEVSVASLIEMPAIDPAIMLGLVAAGLLDGKLTTELDKRLFGRTSMVRRGEGSPQTSLSPIAAVLAGISDEQTAALDNELGTPGEKGKLPNRGRPRNLVPLAHRDYRQWVQIDEKTLLRERGEIISMRFKKRTAAVQMYLDEDVGFPEIEKATGLSQYMVLYWVKRCLIPDAAGGIIGFPALVGVRNGYNRRAPQLGTQGSGSAGYAGEFGRLMSAYPKLAELIENLLFGEDPDSIPETRIPYTAIHEVFKSNLRAAGLTNDDYPFNTDDVGYQSLYRYCKELEAANPFRSRTAREGHNAGNRRDGRGPLPRFRALRPLSIVQLDFHYTDAIGIVILVDENGVEHELPVARFYIGLLIDEHSASILGFHYLLQIQPSADSVLDVVESALYPREFREDDPHLKFTPDGKFLMNSFIEGLARHGFTMLRMDRGWSNIAKDVTNNIMSSLGCALHFGPSASWWVRPLIERIFETLTKRGLQRMPSTLGANTQDVRKDHPVETAIRYRILLSDLLSVIASEIQRFNTEGHIGTFNASPLEVVQAAMTRHESPYMPQPLPLDRRQDWTLFAHVESIRISRDRNGARPCVRVSAIDCRYSNSYLAESDWLVGEQLLVCINRRDVSQAIGVLADTGTHIGELKAEGRFREGRVTWTEAVALKRDGHIRTRHSGHVAAATQVRAQKVEEGQKAAQSKSKRAKAQRGALAAAKQQLDHKDDPQSTDPQAQWQRTNDTYGAFGFPLKVVSGKGKN